MKNDNSHSDKIKGGKKITRLIAIGAILTFIFLAFVISAGIIPALQSNGTENFKGAKKEAAQEVYDLAAANIDGKSILGYKIRVESVYPTPSGTCSTDSVWVRNLTPNDARYYTVKISIKQLFTYTPAKTEIHTPCNKYW